MIKVQKIGYVVLAIGLAGVVYFLFMFDWGAANTSSKTLADVWFEIFKFSLLTMTVGGATIIYNQVKAEQEKRAAAAEKKQEQERTNLQKQRDREAELERARAARELALRQYEAQRIEQFFRDLTHTYNNIKSIRRLLRHFSTPAGVDHFEIPNGRYGDAMIELNRKQLELEFGRRLARLKPTGLENISEAAVDELGKAEDYLREVIREFEKADLSNPGGKTTFSHSSALGRFIASSSPKGANTEVSGAFFSRLDVIYREIVEQMDNLAHPATALTDDREQNEPTQPGLA